MPAGSISGTNVSLEAGNNITNETTVSDVQYRELHQVTVDQVGSITASGDLSLKAGQNVELKGSGNSSRWQYVPSQPAIKLISAALLPATVSP